MSDSKLSAAHRNLRNLDGRVIDISWRKDKSVNVTIDTMQLEFVLFHIKPTRR
jgi:hypothetical protein